MVMYKSWLRFINQQFNFKLSTGLICAARVRNEGLLSILRKGKQSTNASLRDAPLLDRLDGYRKTEQGH